MGTDLIKASERRMLDIRGARISMILQDPKFSLNPVQHVGDQIAEAYAVHHRGARRWEKALEMLEAVQESATPSGSTGSIQPRDLGWHGPAGDDRHDAGAGAGS